jgi:hypothetical protein
MGNPPLCGKWLRYLSQALEEMVGEVESNQHEDYQVNRQNASC